MYKRGLGDEEQLKGHVTREWGQISEHEANIVKGNLSELQQTTFMVVIPQVPNSNNNRTSSMQLQASYTDVTHWEELIDFIKKQFGPKEPYCLAVIYKCIMIQEALDKEYI